MKTTIVLSFVAAVSAWSLPSKRDDISRLLARVDHTWIAAGPTDSRSPCPCLNTLANHNFLPRNGQNLTIALLSSTLQTVLNLNKDLADALSGEAGQLATNGTLSLHDLALHGFIEHDASLAHDDANGAKYAPVTPNATLIQQLLADSTDGKVLTYWDFAKARVRREATLSAPLSGNVGKGEPVLLTQVFGAGTNISNSNAALVLGQEKFPADYVRPVTAVPLSVLVSGRNTIANDMALIRGS